MSKHTRKRWPDWVYGEGREPDYRFSFANERTFLAWIRTSLAVLAAGVALDVVDLSLGAYVQHGLAVLLVALGLVSAVLAWVRWALAEKAMRAQAPLPAFRFGAIFTLCVVISAAVAILSGL
jgi:putative membrane protein